MAAKKQLKAIGIWLRNEEYEALAVIAAPFGGPGKLMKELALATIQGRVQMVPPDPKKYQLTPTNHEEA